MSPRAEPPTGPFTWPQAFESHREKMHIHGDWNGITLTLDFFKLKFQRASGSPKAGQFGDAGSLSGLVFSPNHSHKEPKTVKSPHALKQSPNPQGEVARRAGQVLAGRRSTDSRGYSQKCSRDSHWNKTAWCPARGCLYPNCDARHVTLAHTTKQARTTTTTRHP